jgi:hypothetical protein
VHPRLSGTFSTIVGDGQRSSVLKFRRTAYTAGKVLIDATSMTGLLLADFGVDTDDAVFFTAGTYAIVLNSATRVHVDRVRINGRGAAGIYGKPMTGVRVTNCIVDATGSASDMGICFYGETAEDVVVSGFRTTGTPTYAGAFGDSSKHCKFIGCHCQGAVNFGYYLGGAQHSLIEGCTSYNTGHEAFQITNGSYCTIQGNTCEWDSSTGTDCGISVAGDTAALTRYNLVANNVIVNAYASGLLCADFADHNTFAGNILKDCGVRGTAGGGSGTTIAGMGQYTSLAAADCSNNIFRGNKIAAVSGAVSYGFAEFNSGAGATMTSNALLDNTWSGTHTTPYLFVSSTSYADDGTWRDGSITIASSIGTITAYTVTTAKFRRRGKTSFFRAIIVVTNNGTGAGGLDVFFPTGIAAGTTSGVIVGRNSTSGVAIIGLANGGGARMTTTAGAYPVAGGDTIAIEGSFENS